MLVTAPKLSGSRFFCQTNRFEITGAEIDDGKAAAVLMAKRPRSDGDMADKDDDSGNLRNQI